MQAFVSHEDCVIVFDGRLDNRVEILSDLRGRGLGGSLISDSALALGAYLAWGEKSAERLLGDFAFAIWDRRQKCLFCARDPVGAKPFYYYRGSDYIVFASDDEALVGLPGVSGRPSEEFAAFFLVREFQEAEADQTWVARVRTLRPAHSLTVSPDGRISGQKYWSFDPGPALRLGSDHAYEEAFRSQFRTAVKDRLRPRGGAAAMVSGGMDSAALIATLLDLIRAGELDTVKAFSAIADDVAASLESRCIQSLVSPSQVSPHFFRVPSFRGLVGLDDAKALAWGQAHPTGNAILIPALMGLAAHRAGCDRLLYAAGGDVAIGSDPGYIAGLLRRGNWGTALRESRMAAAHHTYLRGHSAAGLFVRSAFSAFAPRRIRAVTRRFRRRRNYLNTGGLDLLNPDFVRHLDLEARLEARRRAAISAPKLNFRDAHCRSLFGSRSLIAAGLVATCRVASHFGIDTSDPWTDRRVLEFLARVPEDYLTRNGWTKFLARSAFANNLDGAVVWRSDKEHLGWTVVRKLLQESEDEIGEFLDEGVEAAGEYLDRRAVRQLHARCIESNNDLDWSVFFDVMTLGLWIRRLAIQEREVKAAFR